MNSPRPGISILVVVGEASGDLHAFQLCKCIQEQAGQPVQVWGSGGDQLATLGARLLAASHQLAAIGPIAAVRQLHRYYGLYRSILREVAIRSPDLVILVDFPDFNLPLARALRKRTVAPIVYFISPQVWAWRRGRVRRIRRTIDKMIVLFPFEVDFYTAHGVPVDYFGHPLANRALPERNRDLFARRHNFCDSDVLVAVLPGSRRPEIESILPVVLRGAELLDEIDRQRLQLVIAPAPRMRNVIENAIDKWISRFRHRLKIEIIQENEEVLTHCDYGLVKSGTSTLEAALAGIPFCVMYRGSSVSWNLVRYLVKTEHFALPNLILNERVVPELIQREANPRAVAEVLSSFLQKDQKWEITRQKLTQVGEKLRAQDPYGDAARSVISLLRNHR